MKKIRLFLLAAIVSVSFAACEKKAPADATTSNEPATEEPAPAPAATQSEEDKLLSDYENLINDLLAVMEKQKSGDAAAMQEYQKLSTDIQDFSVKAQEIMPKLSADQLKKYEEIAKKYTDAVQSMMGQ